MTYEVGTQVSADLQPARLCCFIGDGPRCSNKAEFEIRTTRLGGHMAGPDPYSDDTDACSAHVGELLGWQPDAVDTDEISWTVHRIQP